MKKLYIDCRSGVSGDMLLSALNELAGIAASDIPQLSADNHHHHHDEQHHSDEHHHHSHSRSYTDVKNIIQHSECSSTAKQYAAAIYENIARAEAKVHEATLETVHFHEVGRDQAIINALGIGRAMEVLSPDEVIVSPIHDGQGTITCSHGEIPIPVPAVKAMMEGCSYTFVTVPVDTEMVTPSGLAGIIGIGAKPAASEELPQGRVIATATATGRRATGRDGLKAYIIEE